MEHSQCFGAVHFYEQHCNVCFLASHQSGAAEPEEEAVPQKVEDESLLAARQGKGVSMRSMFENNQNSGTSSPKAGDMESGDSNATRHQDELAAIRASR